MIYDDLERELAQLGVTKPKPNIRITQILMLRRRGMTDKQIGLELGLPTDEVRKRRHEALARDYKAGVPTPDMAVTHCIKRGHIARTMQTLGVPLRVGKLSRLDEDEALARYQSHTRTDRGPSGWLYSRIAEIGLPLISEEVEPPPRDELEDALGRWGELGTAQEYHVTVKHVRRWVAHYDIEVSS